jgi:5-methylcytosine-specific restriction endonuclease McrA
MNEYKTCNACGQTKDLEQFYKRGANSDKRMAVCKACKDSYATNYAKAHKAPPTYELGQCLNCQKSFEMKRSWQIACSYECRYFYQNNKEPKALNEGLCARCGKSLKHKRADAIYCSKNCASKDHNFKHRGSEPSRVSTARRRLIIERDNSTCYLCKQIVPASSIEIDHLVPRSRKGTSAATNLSVTCRDCNRGRGNRIGIEQLIRLYELRPADDC